MITAIVGIGIAIGIIAAAMSVGVAWVWVMEVIDYRRSRGLDTPVKGPEGADPRRIDDLERELEIGKYSPAARELQLELDVESALEQMKTVSGFGKITEHEWRLALKKVNDRGLTPKVIVCGVEPERHSMAACQLDILESKNPDVDPRFLAIGLVWRYGAGGEFDQQNGRGDRKVGPLTRAVVAEWKAVNERSPIRTLVDEDGNTETIRAFGS